MKTHGMEVRIMQVKKTRALLITILMNESIEKQHKKTLREINNYFVVN